MVREVEALSRLLGEPERPFAAILGGAKIEGKIDTLENLLPRLDVLMVGGGMANTFLAAHGYDLKASLVERDRLELASEILARAAERGIEFLLPTDLVVADAFEDPKEIHTVPVDAVPDGFLALDIGPATRAAFAARRRERQDAVLERSARRLREAAVRRRHARAGAALGACSGFTLIGGGETVAAAHQAGVAEQLGHVSTGGGASLEFLAGRELPGVAALARG